jgi:hypothetical protein
MRLEELASGVLVKGLLPNKPVKLLHVIPRESDSMILIFKDGSGTLQPVVGLRWNW